MFRIRSAYTRKTGYLIGSERGIVAVAKFILLLPSTLHTCKIFLTAH